MKLETKSKMDLKSLKTFDTKIEIYCNTINLLKQLIQNLKFIEILGTKIKVELYGGKRFHFLEFLLPLCCTLK